MARTELGTPPVIPLMWKLALPAIAMQLINLLYGIVDRMYIGRLAGVAAPALTGLSLCLPPLMFVSACAALAGNGGSVLCSVELGRGNGKQAERILGQSTLMLLAFCVVLTALLLILRESILLMLGASSAALPYAMDYLTVYLCGSPFVLLSTGLGMFAVCQGKTKVALSSALIGAVVNAVLDPVLIYAFDMGVAGAAAASVAAQALSAAWILRFLLSGNSSVRLRMRSLRPDFALIGRISAIGVSPFLMQVVESVTAAVFNLVLAPYGDAYVGSMAILQSVMQLSVVLVNGFTTGAAPIIGFAYGAKNYPRCREAVRHLLTATSAMAAVTCLAAVLFPGDAARLFTDNAEIVSLTALVLPPYFAGRWLYGVQASVQAVFVTVNEAGRSLFLALLRKVLLLIPLLLTLPRLVGVMGVYWAEAAADAASSAVAGVLLLRAYPKLFPVNKKKRR